MPFNTSPITPRSHRHGALWISLAVSAAIHLVVLLAMHDAVIEPSEPEQFRTRLARIPRFQPRRFAVTEQPAAPGTEMQYLATEALPQEMEELSLGALMELLLEIEAPLQPLALREFFAGEKADEPVLPSVFMPRPGERVPPDSLVAPAMDLLRFVDMAQAGRDPALVMLDPASRRDMLGYLNLTRLRLDGAGSSIPGLYALARYVRDHSNLLIRMQDNARDHFISEELLKDPILFLVQGGGFPPSRSDRLVHLSAEEEERMGEYLRSGGTLFIEGSNRFLREMVAHLQAVFGHDAYLFPLPADHSVYDSFYSFEDGFPGEQGKHTAYGMASGYGWRYPAEAPPSEAESAAAAHTQQAGQTELPEGIRGLWGVAWEGQTVALLSDIGLAAQWTASFDTQQSSVTPQASAPALQAGMNIIFHALTRDGTLTPQRERPGWMQTRPMVALTRDNPEEEEVLEPDAEMLSQMDASVAVMRAPPGTDMDGASLTIRFNGAYRMDFPSVDGHGVLVHNLPAGSHWLDIGYDGKTQQVALELTGGHVTTVTFRMERLAFVRQLKASVQKREVWLPQWRSTFSDLQVEDVYLGPDRDLIEASRLSHP